MLIFWLIKRIWFWSSLLSSYLLSLLSILLSILLPSLWILIFIDNRIISFTIVLPQPFPERFIDIFWQDIAIWGANRGRILIFWLQLSPFPKLMTDPLHKDPPLPPLPLEDTFFLVDSPKSHRCMYRRFGNFFFTLNFHLDFLRLLTFLWPSYYSALQWWYPRSSQGTHSGF